MANDPHSPGRPPEPEQPRSEPEIIPPGRDDARHRARDPGGPNVFVYVDQDGRTHRVNIKRPGPFTIGLILLAVALVVATFLAVVVGALFVILPAIAIIVLGVIAYAYARGFWRRFRGGSAGGPPM